MITNTWPSSPAVAPGAKSRIEEKLARLKDINENRPCSNCANKTDSYSTKYYAYGCNTCNFNHDNFAPKQQMKVEAN